MVCPNCDSETNGLKLNNRLYCTECGFLLSQPEPKPISTVFSDIQPPEVEEKDEPVKTIVFHEPEPKEDAQPVTPAEEPKIISDTEEFSLAPLEAEEEVLDLVEKKAIELEAEAKKKKIEPDLKPDNSEAQDIRNTIEAQELTPIGVVQAEEEPKVLEKPNPAPEELPSTEEKPSLIKKHNRTRTDQKKEAKEKPVLEPKKPRVDFQLIPGEPDPINEPEIEAGSPDVDPEPIKTDNGTDGSRTLEIEEVVEDIRKKAFQSEEPKSVIDLDIDNEKTEVEKKLEEKEEKKTLDSHKQDVLLNYFRQIGGKPANSAKEVPKPKKEAPKNRKWITGAIILGTLLVLLFVGFVLYVNLYAAKPENALKKSESTVSFNYLKPTYLPAGYALSYKTSATADSIEYIYEYQPDKIKTISAVMAKTSLKSESIKQDLVDPSGKGFNNIRQSGHDYWIVDEQTLYFIQNEVLYTLRSFDNIPSSELVKIADGLK